MLPRVASPRLHPQGRGSRSRSVRIGVFDPTGHGLGTAIGLAELGHAVAYAAPPAWSAPHASEASRLAAELARHCLGPATVPDPAACDLVVAVDTFADHLAAIDRCDAARRGTGPAPTAWEIEAVLVYPERLGRWCELSARSAHLAVIDASDLRRPRETGFEFLAGVTLLAREVGPGDGLAWRPFPFLWNTVLLWLEHLRPESEWRVPAAARPRHHDWAFCGTVEHARYGEARRQGLAAARARWPQLRGVVRSDLAFRDVLALLQAGRFGLDLPGAGELCFRQHECLALGVPLLQVAPFTIATAPGVQAAVADDPAALAGLDVAAVRAIYRDCASPRAAATALLAAVEAGVPVGS